MSCPSSTIAARAAIAFHQKAKTRGLPRARGLQARGDRRQAPTCSRPASACSTSAARPGRGCSTRAARSATRGVLVGLDRAPLADARSPARASSSATSLTIDAAELRGELDGVRRRAVATWRPDTSGIRSIDQARSRGAVRARARDRDRRCSRPAATSSASCSRARTSSSCIETGAARASTARRRRSRSRAARSRSSSTSSARASGR